MRQRWWLAVAMAGTVMAQTSGPDLDAEIGRLRRELAQTQNERERNAQDFAKDRKDHEQYLKGAAERYQQARRTNDSLRVAIRAAQHRADSLAALIELARTEQKQAELSQERLRARLVASVRTILGLTRRMPPLAARHLAAPLALLESELLSKNVSNEEALSRMHQILLQMGETTASIHVVQETSPLPDLRGTVYRLRIGTFFEAMADVRGERYAVWEGYDASGKPKWAIGDGGVAAAIVKAANVRDGKALPALVSLPLAPGADAGGVR